MKKKGSFLSGLIVFILIIIILGGVGYLGFNVIKNANGMAGMNMSASTTASETAKSESASSETAKSDTGTSSTVNSANTEVTNNTSDTATTAATTADNTYKMEQINQAMVNKQTLENAYETVNSALQKMTLDPYAAEDESTSSMNGMSNQASGDSSSSSITQSDTTVNIYTGDVAGQQTTQMQSMGQTYDATKMQQLHSGLYKVSVGMKLLKQLKDNIEAQILQASADTSDEVQFYINMYNNILQDKSKLNEALTYINDAVELINVNPYVDANGLVYDKERMTQLHDSIYLMAQGVVDLDSLNDNLLTQSVNLTTLAQNAYDSMQTDSSASTTTMDMSSGINISTIITGGLILFVVIFVIGILGSIMNLFKPRKQTNDAERLV